MVPTTGALIESARGPAEPSAVGPSRFCDDEERNHAEVRHDRRFVLCQPCHDLDVCRGPLLLPQEMLSPGSNLLCARADLCRAGGRAGNYASDRYDRASAPHGGRCERIGGRLGRWKADVPQLFLRLGTTAPRCRAGRQLDETPRGPAARVPGRPQNVRPAVRAIAQAGATAGVPPSGGCQAAGAAEVERRPPAAAGAPASSGGWRGQSGASQRRRRGLLTFESIAPRIRTRVERRPRHRWEPDIITG